MTLIYYCIEIYLNKNMIMHRLCTFGGEENNTSIPLGHGKFAYARTHSCIVQVKLLKI